jgi:hypothetical protein
VLGFARMRKVPVNHGKELGFDVALAQLLINALVDSVG